MLQQVRLDLLRELCYYLVPPLKRWDFLFSRELEMDSVDHANNDLEVIKSAKIHTIRRKASEPVFTGYCKFCGDIIEEGGFCDPNCRHKFQLKSRG